jgi:hypothetical protein
MDVDRAGNVYIGAQISDSAWFEDDYQYVCNGYHNGFRDLFIAKYTSDGELDWLRIMNSSYAEWSFSLPYISCITAIDVDRLIIGGRFTNHLELTPFNFFSLNTHGMVAFLGEPTWIPENGKISEAGFEMYPNPATDKVTFSFQYPDQVVNKITISDVSGRSFMETRGSLKTGEVHIDVGSLAPGIYIVNIKGNYPLTPGKLIVNK